MAGADWRCGQPGPWAEFHSWAGLHRQSRGWAEQHRAEQGWAGLVLTGGVGSQGLGLSSTVGLVCTGRAGAGLSSTGQSRAGLGWEFHFSLHFLT